MGNEYKQWACQPERGPLKCVGPECPLYTSEPERCDWKEWSFFKMPADGKSHPVKRKNHEF